MTVHLCPDVPYILSIGRIGELFNRKRVVSELYSFPLFNYSCESGVDMKMRRSIRFVILLPLCMVQMTLNAQSYDKLWKEVGKAERNGLPQTAIKYAEEIFRKAEAGEMRGRC